MWLPSSYDSDKIGASSENQQCAASLLAIRARTNHGPNGSLGAWRLLGTPFFYKNGIFFLARISFWTWIMLPRRPAALLPSCHVSTLTQGSRARSGQLRSQLIQRACEGP